MADSNQLQILDAIQGNNFLAIQSGIDLLQPRRLDFAHLRIDLLQEGDSAVVVLANENGSSNEDLGVTLKTGVELTAEDLHSFGSGGHRGEARDGLRGNSFLAIQAAIEVFKRHNLDLRDYNIEVVRERGSLVVIFFDKDRPAGTRGSVGRPGFEVELDARDLRVIRSNYVR